MHGFIIIIGARGTSICLCVMGGNSNLILILINGIGIYSYTFWFMKPDINLCFKM